jgi:N-hydroxyarylamine O-acetyltransferase
MAAPSALSPDLVERVLEGLGFDSRPEVSRDGLAQLYSAWCLRVPSDNACKLIYLRGGETGPLPGDEPARVFESWLEHGTGGTCWSASGALHSLLDTLGFRAQRVLATITFAPDLPPNHGSTVVDLGDERFLVDTSLLHDEPLLLSEERETAVVHPAWGMPARFEDGHFWLTASPLLSPSPFPCRLDLIGASAAQIRERHEATRDWGPFNYALSVRVNRRDRVLGLAWGKRIEIDPAGELTRVEFSDDERARWLVDEIGLSEEIVARIPEDLPTPAPPGSATAETIDSI